MNKEKPLGLAKYMKKENNIFLHDFKNLRWFPHLSHDYFAHKENQNLQEYVVYW